MYQQVYHHKATRAAEALIRGIFLRVAALIRGGRVPEHTPPAVVAAMSGETVRLSDYLQLDDVALLHAFRVWESDADPALATLTRHCDEIGRDIATIEKTVSFPIVLRDDADAADARIHELMAANGVPPSDFGGYVADTPAAVADVLRKHLDLGFETVIVRMPAPYDYETIERMPEVADLLVR